MSDKSNFKPSLHRPLLINTSYCKTTMIVLYQGSPLKAIMFYSA